MVGLPSFHVLFIFLFKIHVQMSNKNNQFLKRLQSTFILVCERPYIKTFAHQKM
jgi:hypothetical protein